MMVNDYATASVINVGGKQMASISLKMGPNDYNQLLVWEEDGLSFQLNMDATTLDEICEVAASVR